MLIYNVHILPNKMKISEIKENFPCKTLLKINFFFTMVYILIVIVHQKTMSTEVF